MSPIGCFKVQCARRITGCHIPDDVSADVLPAALVYEWIAGFGLCSFFDLSDCAADRLWQGDDRQTCDRRGQKKRGKRPEGGFQLDHGTGSFCLVGSVAVRLKLLDSGTDCRCSDALGGA